MMAHSQNLGRIQVTMYTKQGCHLCEDLLDALRVMQQDLDFSIVERDIERDPDEFKRFRELIPALDVPGVGLIYPPHDSSSVRQAVSAAVESFASNHV